MARYTFGGKIEQLVVAADSSLGGALKAAPGATLPTLYNKPVTDGTRVVVTDFLTDPDNNGTFTVAVTSITVDSSGYPPYFQGPDGVSILYDETGRRYDSNDIAAGLTVPAASTTTAGVAEIATLAEVATGTDTTRIVTAEGVKQQVDSHRTEAFPHPDIDAAIDSVQASLATKANLVGGYVPDDEILSSTDPTPDTLVRRRVLSGTVAAAQATLADELVTYQQLIDNLETGGSNDVRALRVTSGLPISLTSDSVWTTIPQIQVTDAASGQEWLCEYEIVYRAITAGGIQVRNKLPGAAVVTNLLANPSFATNTNNWSTASYPATTLTRVNAAGYEGTGYALMTANSAATLNMVSEWVPITGGVTIYSAAAYGKLNSGTGRVLRIDLQYGNNNVVLATGGTDLGSTGQSGNSVTVDGTWQRSVNNPLATSTDVVPAGATQVRVRVAYQTAAVGDSVQIDAVQLEPSIPLPAYGSTGGGGDTAFSIDGTWDGLRVDATAATDYSKSSVIRYPSNSDLSTSWGGFTAATSDAVLRGSFNVRIGGTGLVNQVLALEVAQRVTNATATTIQAARATFARVV
jgi:hypothetical protein